MMKSDFVGTGSMKEFVEESDKLFSAFSNAVVLVPSGYSGSVPTIEVEETGADSARLVLDMGDAQVFTLNNVKWIFRGDALIETNAAYVNNGILNIEVEAKSVCP